MKKGADVKPAPFLPKTMKRSCKCSGELHALQYHPLGIF